MNLAASGLAIFASTPVNIELAESSSRANLAAKIRQFSSMAEKRQLTYIELFSGCGGMSLGLESSGFKRLLANEISPMAAETFAFNLVKGARKSGDCLQPADPKTWDSHFKFLQPPEAGPDGLLSERKFRDWRVRKDQKVTVTQAIADNVLGSSGSNLLVGDAGKLRDLLKILRSRNPKRFWKQFGDLDLLAGGPPCQSFSLAGKRQRDHPRNRLFYSFVDIARELKPKIILFENVLGITRPFQDETGEEWHPWHEVCRAFLGAGYIPIPSLVNAVEFGVPQSRPRFIMVAVAEKIAERIRDSRLWTSGLAEAFERGKRNFAKDRRWNEGDDRHLIYRTGVELDVGSWPIPLFPLPTTRDNPVTVTSAIQDLLNLREGGNFIPGAYALNLSKLLPPPAGIVPNTEPKNHGLRKHGVRTRARFRLLRRLAKRGFHSKNMKQVAAKAEEVARLLEGELLLVLKTDGSYFEPRRGATKAEVLELIAELASSKNVQKCLDPARPAGAQLSIPDDSIHWDEDRVLTIREMARIQSFPDWFEFRSKETTGGNSRAYEVPQYTQVGNAVPPLLALAFGTSIRKFLEQVDRLAPNARSSKRG